MRRHRKPYALQLRDELSKGGNVVVPNGAVAPAPVAGVVVPKPTNGVIQPKNNNLSSLINSTQKKVEAETPPLTFEETFRGKQETLIGILRMLVYESEFSSMIQKGQLNQATFDQLKAAAHQAYKMWPKEIYAAMLAYQKSRLAANGTSK